MAQEDAFSKEGEVEVRPTARRYEPVRTGPRDEMADLSRIQSHQSSRSRMNQDDVDTRMDLEEKDNSPPSPSETRTIVYFKPNDQDNPYNWPLWKKVYISLSAVALVFNSTISTSIPSNCMDTMSVDLHISESSFYLPVAVYMVGYIFGPLVFSPMSETFGRKLIIFSTFSTFVLFTLGCALTKSLAALLVFRFITGACGCVPLTVIGGLYADIYRDPVTRGRAMAMFMASTMFGPCLGPVIAGSVPNWRWAFWVALMIAGCSWIPMAFLPETFGPIILKRRAQRLRKTTGNPNFVAPVELETRSFSALAVVILTRPLRMLMFEPIVLSTCLYMATVYGFFYLFLEAYPIIFQTSDIYNFTNAQVGLAFLPIGVGAIGTGVWVLCYDTYLISAKEKGKSWASSEEFRRLPVTCVGGPFCTVGLFWLAWSARSSVHWIVPCLSGLPFGFGYLSIFIGLNNYLTDAYEIFAASAMAAGCFSRSLIAVAVPFAAQPMYNRLGVAWATSLLGFLSLPMVFVPFVLIYFGTEIRKRSEFCQFLLQRRQKLAEEEKEREERMLREKGQQRSEV